ncbi:hypothetical protein ASC87_04365 [Rhizobacter sp. Root1221]|nr:hypothetical protein ASC87_04365 [Rhizobacter sp. Root1221]
MKDDRFPSALQAGALVLVLFLCEYLVSAALHDVFGSRALPVGERWVFASLLGNGIVFTVLMHLKGGTYRDLFHATTLPARAACVLLVPPVLMLIPAMVLGCSVIDDWIVAALPMSRWEEQIFAQMAANDLPTIVAVCILAPILEEMLFRGVILRGFLARYPRPLAIAGSAMCFGLAHLNVYQFIGAFLSGLVLGWLYERTRSLIPCIALHAGHNTMITVLEMTVDSPATFSAPAWAWTAALAASAAGSYLLWRMLAAPPGPRDAPR